MNVTSGASELQVGFSTCTMREKIFGGVELQRQWCFVGGETEWLCTNWITRTKTEAESVGFIEVERVGVKDAKVHLPFFIIVGGDEADARRKGLLDLGAFQKSGRGQMGRTGKLPW